MQKLGLESTKWSVTKVEHAGGETTSLVKTNLGLVVFEVCIYDEAFVRVLVQAKETGAFQRCDLMFWSSTLCVSKA